MALAFLTGGLSLIFFCFILFYVSLLYSIKAGKKAPSWVQRRIAFQHCCDSLVFDRLRRTCVLCSSGPCICLPELVEWLRVHVMVFDRLRLTGVGWLRRTLAFVTLSLSKGNDVVVPDVRDSAGKGNACICCGTFLTFTLPNFKSLQSTE